MCQGFGGIITIYGDVLFCEPDIDGNCSHSVLLERMPILKDIDQFSRMFVRFEFPLWTENSFTYDEYDTLPVWVKEEYKEKAIALLHRVRPIWKPIEEKIYEAYGTRASNVAEAWRTYLESDTMSITEYRDIRDSQDRKLNKFKEDSMKEFIDAVSGFAGYVPLEVEYGRQRE